MAKQTNHTITSYEDLLAYEAMRDQAICGVKLEEPYASRLSEKGAHDPTPTPYFVLEALFESLALDDHSHLLDVGCGTGRVLAYYLEKGYPGRATGIELDPYLARFAQTWASSKSNLEVLQGDVLDLDLGIYTDFYLFNPFDQGILQQFIYSLEGQARSACTVIHMSDNGDAWRYRRAGWSELSSGAFSTIPGTNGRTIKLYDHPQHYTVWRYDPSL